MRTSLFFSPTPLSQTRAAKQANPVQRSSIASLDFVDSAFNLMRRNNESIKKANANKKYILLLRENKFRGFDGDMA